MDAVVDARGGCSEALLGSSESFVDSMESMRRVGLPLTDFDDGLLPKLTNNLVFCK